MDVWIYQASLWCEDCIAEVIQELETSGIIDGGDSDTYPQGPYPDGGGEAGVANHCEGCGVELENPVINFRGW